MSEFKWANINEKNGDVTLRKFDGLKIKDIEKFNKEDIIKVAILDTETTGLDYKQDHIIELAFLIFEYDIKQKKIIKLIDKYNELNDPGEEITEDITKITGITTKDVLGKHINWKDVSNKLEKVDICICHNARFDRSFFHKYTNQLENIPWLCSYTQIPWNDEFNYPTQKQEVLTLYHGFYYTGHRALNDCEALAELLLMDNPNLEISYLEYLLEKRNQDEYLLISKNTVFAQKPFFNENNFSWEPNGKMWYKSLTEKEEAEELFVNLSEKIYVKRRIEAEIVDILPEQKFKALEIILKEASLKTNFKENKKMVLISKKSPFKTIIKTRDNTDKEVETRFLFKLKGYEWYPKDKVWYIYLDEHEVEDEKEWLRKFIYKGDFIGEVKNNKYYKKSK